MQTTSNNKCLDSLQSDSSWTHHDTSSFLAGECNVVTMKGPWGITDSDKALWWKRNRNSGTSRSCGPWPWYKLLHGIRAQFEPAQPHNLTAGRVPSCQMLSQVPPTSNIQKDQYHLEVMNSPPMAVNISEHFNRKLAPSMQHCNLRFSRISQSVSFILFHLLLLFFSLSCGRWAISYIHRIALSTNTKVKHIKKTESEVLAWFIAGTPKVVYDRPWPNGYWTWRGGGTRPMDAHRHREFVFEHFMRSIDLSSWLSLRCAKVIDAQSATPTRAHTTSYYMNIIHHWHAPSYIQACVHLHISTHSHLHRPCRHAGKQVHTHLYVCKYIIAERGA